MKFIKKHKNKLFILMLTLISALTLFLNVGKTYAYTYDEETNTITSDNLIQLNNVNTTTYNGITYSVNKGEIILNGTNETDNYLFINFILTSNINSGIYSVNWYNNQISNDILCYYANIQGQGEYTGSTLLRNINTSVNNINLVNGISQLRVRINANTTINNLSLKPMLINGETAPTIYEPYGTFINETLYNNLEEDYSSLQELYNDLDEEFTNLQNAYDEQLEAYNDLQDDFNNLEDNYNELQQQYNETNNYNQYGDLYNSTLYIETNINGTRTDHTLTFNDMVTNDIISNSFLYYTKAFQYLNIDTSVGFTTTTLQLSKPIPTSNLNWTYNNENLSGIVFDLEYVGNDEDWYVSFATDSASPFDINTNFLLRKQLGTNYDISNDSFDQFILNFNYATPNEVWLSNNTNYADSYNRGYNNGYRQGYNSQREEYEPLIINLRNELQTLNEQIVSQRVVINALQEQISSMSSDYNLNNLMWTIASTPFESFKQIWNVNFLGVNITQMVTGLLTAFIVLYIVKKFFL